MPHQVTPPVLPFDIVQEIIDTLDAENDRPTLLSFLRVSKACWDSAARVLYRRILLNKDQIQRLFLPGRDDMAIVADKPELRLVQLSPRMRRALTFADRVDFDSIEEEHIYVLWAATLPDTPLFPNAGQVTSRHPRSKFPFTTTYPQKDVPHDVDIFDSADVCAHAQQALAFLEYLPIKRIKSMNVHDAGNLFYGWQDFPNKWEELRCFDNGARWWADQGNKRFDKTETFLDDVDPDCNLPPVQFVLPTDQWEDLTLANLYEGSEWVPSPTSRIQFTFDHVDWRAPPCVICGTRFDWPEDTLLGYKGAPYWFMGN